MELDAFEELIAIDNLGIAVGHHVRVFDEDHLNLLLHVELTSPMKPPCEMSCVFGNAWVADYVSTRLAVCKGNMTMLAVGV